MVRVGVLVRASPAVAALLAALFFLPTMAAAASPGEWVAAFFNSARAAGISRATYDRALRDFVPDPDVLASASAQPEFTMKPWEYLDRIVSDDRVEDGAGLLAKYADVLARIEARYKVDRKVVVAVWGIESDFGALPGKKSVVRSLATLAYSGGRLAAFGREQLIGALKILERGDVTPEGMVGSWAGAMGQTQFIPTSYEAYAVDFDGDGRRNIWTSIPDALASTANLLARSGWQSGEAWGYEVRVPANLADSGERSVGAWENSGVRRITGQAFPRPGDRATLWRPNGANGPAFLLLKNFSVIKRYNNSNLYALAVGHLSDRVSGLQPFVTPWPPHDLPLSEAERQRLQLFLTMQGHYDGEIDGVIGNGSREAIRAYQRSAGVKADGADSRALLRRLEEDG
jgi:membrane-bound lytic murein transglycosylase B